MSSSIVVERVSHTKYGQGTVLAKRAGGFFFSVRFDRGLTFWVRGDECAPIGISKPRSVKGVEERRLAVAPLSSEKLSSMCMIETLRLGIVPLDEVGSFTYGRDQEIQNIRNLLDKGSSTTFIVGDYGSGKSHLLSYIEDDSLKKGWVVSNLQIDPNECPLHRPKRVYNRIIKSARYGVNGEKRSIRELMHSFGSRHKGGIGHPYLDPVLNSFHKGSDSEDVWDWIEGAGETAYPGLPMYDDSPSANVYCYILSGIAELARLSGLKGFLIMFDEAEQTSGSWYYTFQFEKGINFFRGLALTSAGSSLLSEKPERNSSPPPVMIGEKTRLPYSARTRPIPYLFRKTPLKMMFGFTKIALTYDLNKKLGASVVELRPLGKDVKREILRAVLATYSNAYPGFQYPDSESLIRDIITCKKYDGNVRTPIKAFIEALDIIRYHKIANHRTFVR